jgi:hypothetical protein
VVVVGLTDGLLVVEVNPDGEEVHEYVFPLTEELPKTVVPPIQMLRLLPTVADGNGLTVTEVVPAELVQPLTVIFTE